MSSISIAGLDKVELLHALWNESPVAAFFSTRDAAGIEVPVFDWEMAAYDVLGSIGYFQGRCIKMDLSGDMVDPSGYDRQNGPGAAARVIAKLSFVNVFHGSI